MSLKHGCYCTEGGLNVVLAGTASTFPQGNPDTIISTRLTLDYAQNAIDNFEQSHNFWNRLVGYYLADSRVADAFETLESEDPVLKDAERELQTVKEDAQQAKEDWERAKKNASEERENFVNMVRQKTEELRVQEQVQKMELGRLRDVNMKAEFLLQHAEEIYELLDRWLEE
jgi:hypothetical protein